MKFSTLLGILAVAIGAVFVFANLPGESSKATRRFLVAQLEPVAAMVNQQRNSSGLYSSGINGKPSTAFDIFVHDGADMDFASCLKSSSSDIDVDGPKLFMLYHNMVARVASCYVGANRPALCQQAGRAKLAAMMEIYLWARQHAVNNEVLAVSRGSDGSDPYEKTWDGPDDHAVFIKLKQLAKDGYISLDDFGWFPRAEIREALQDVEAERTPCLTQASAQP
jgi:hypothetical protein